MEQHDDVMRATCLTCGAAGPNCKEDADNPGNHYCARCWKKYWEAVGARCRRPQPSRMGLPPSLVTMTTTTRKRQRRQQKSLTGHLRTPPPPHNRPNHLQKLILFALGEGIPGCVISVTATFVRSLVVTPFKMAR